MLKSELITILDNNKEFVQTKEQLNKFVTPQVTTSTIISEYLSLSDLKNYDEKHLVQYLLYNMLIDLLAFSIKSKAINKQWVQMVGETEYDLTLEDVSVGVEAWPVIIITGEVTQNNLVTYVGKRDFRIHMNGYGLSSAEFNKAIDEKVRLYAYPLCLSNSGHREQLKLGEFTFNKLCDFLKSLI